MVAEETFCIQIEGLECLMSRLFTVNALHVCVLSLNRQIFSIRMSRWVDIADYRANFHYVLITVAH